MEILLPQKILIYKKKLYIKNLLFIIKQYKINYRKSYKILFLGK